MQSDTARLIGVDGRDNCPMTGFASASDEVFEKKGTDSAAVVVVMEIDRVFDGMSISATRMISRERAPADDFTFFEGNRDRVFRTVVGEPGPPTFNRLRLFLIGAGRVEDVMVINVIDCYQIGFCCQTNLDGIWF